MAFSIASLEGTTWLAEPRGLQLAIQRVAAHRGCPTLRQVATARRTAMAAAAAAPSKSLRGSSGAGRIGIIPIWGMLDQRMSPALMKAGGTSCEEVAAALDALLAAPDVEQILLHIDSPGGYSHGIEELADRIYEARSRKPIHAIADSTAASAAYWLATSASTLAVTSGGAVGSVGVYAIHTDQSGALAQDGVRITLVSAGRYKTEANPFAPLSDEARQHLQEQVDRDYGRFLQALARNRGKRVATIEDRFGQGRLVDAHAALAAGMVDRVLSFQGLLQQLRQGDQAGQRSAAGATRASTEMLRLRHEHSKRHDEALQLALAAERREA